MLELGSFQYLAPPKSIPAAFASVSSYSASGIESATIPRADVEIRHVIFSHAVRMEMLNWLSRLNPRYPWQPCMGRARLVQVHRHDFHRANFAHR
jgi:hypothetical protein